MKKILLALMLFAAPAYSQVTVPLIADIADDGQPAPVSVTCTWSMLTGPAAPTIATPSKTFTVLPAAGANFGNAVFSVAGSYVLRLSCNDGKLKTDADTAFTVAINKAPTIKIVSPAPGASVAFNRNLSIRAEADGVKTTVLIDGKVMFDTDRKVVEYQWKPGPGKRGKQVSVVIRSEAQDGTITERGSVVEVK